MKNRFLPILLILATPVMGFARDSDENARRLSTSGSADIVVVPDIADLSFGVEVHATDLLAGQKEQAAKMEALLNALRALKIEERDLQSTQVVITPHYEDEYRWVDAPKLRYYKIEQTVNLTTRNIKGIPEITVAAIRAGVTNSNGATLRTTELRKYRDMARVKAIRAAKEKAALLAEAAEAKLGPVVTLNENSNFSYGRSYSTSNAISQVRQEAGPEADAVDGGKGYATGTITISSSVSMTFALE